MNLLPGTPREEEASRSRHAVSVFRNACKNAGKASQYVIDLYRPETKVFAECPIQAAAHFHGKGIVCTFQFGVNDSKGPGKQNS